MEPDKSANRIVTTFRAAGDGTHRRHGRTAHLAEPGSVRELGIAVSAPGSHLGAASGAVDRALPVHPPARGTRHDANPTRRGSVGEPSARRRRRKGMKRLWVLVAVLALAACGKQTVSTGGGSSVTYSTNPVVARRPGRAHRRLRAGRDDLHEPSRGERLWRWQRHHDRTANHDLSGARRPEPPRAQARRCPACKRCSPPRRRLAS